MDNFDDYEVTVSDLEPYKPSDVTKPHLINIFNKKISEHWSQENSVKVLEIDVRPEWEKILREDGSILWGYQKLGWIVFHYHTQKKNGTVRSWLKFSHPNYKGRK